MKTVSTRFAKIEEYLSDVSVQDQDKGNCVTYISVERWLCLTSAWLVRCSADDRWARLFEDRHTLSKSKLILLN